MGLEEKKSRVEEWSTASVEWVKRVVEVVVYTALTFIATVVLVVETPATGGYFNLGEAAIYSVAFTASAPLVAGLAGGLGPALADIVLGYGFFAPATLAIKFAEGFVVASLIKRWKKGISLASRTGGFLLAALLATITWVFLGREPGGSAEASVSWINASLAGYEFSLPSLYLALPGYVWLAIGGLALVLGAIVLLAPRSHYYVVSMAIGGVIMVAGYFAYEYFISNPLILHRSPIGALFEVPVNVGQVVAGIILSYPVVRFVERARGAA